MTLFTLLHHFIAPITSLFSTPSGHTRRSEHDRNGAAVPPHLRQDIFSDDRFWRQD
ncbi:hypothetical protein [Martelella mediterranea]|uniref:Uncharacterized protein n=1 Tax=Martelella mediterranea TaxID=293089 RepID=A0A4R3NVM1_9HYPH|nr:hypothetical protein [Martelella mediterranea]TCT43170.1 hypothetical protein EDC90_1003181 [Martelella mediterranea]